MNILLVKKGLTIFLVFLFFSIIGCKTTFNTPESSLNDVEFLIFPHVVKKNDKYYLEYQLKSSKQADTAPLVRILGNKVVGEKAYYFFSVAISHIDFGEIVERDISQDGFSEFVEKDAIFWLNKDQSEVKLNIDKDLD